MIKMLVVDIDGTILSWDSTITGKVKTYLRTLVDNGIKVVIATGRMYTSAKQVAEAVGIEVPLVCYQGALIKEFADGKIIHEIPLQCDIAKTIIPDLKNDDHHINLYINDELIVEKATDYIQEYAISKKVIYQEVGDFDNIEFDNLNKILVMNKNPDKIIKLIDFMKKKYKDKVYTVRSTPNYCEIANLNANKGNAIKFLAKKWGIKIEEVMAIGDQDNDIEMIETAGIGVAMGNATKELKSVADHITDTVDNDGVVKAIEQFINVEDLEWNTELVKDTTFTK